MYWLAVPQLHLLKVWLYQQSWNNTPSKWIKLNQWASGHFAQQSDNVNWQHKNTEAATSVSLKQPWVLSEHLSDRVSDLQVGPLHKLHKLGHTADLSVITTREQHSPISQGRGLVSQGIQRGTKERVAHILLILKLNLGMLWMIVLQHNVMNSDKHRLSMQSSSNFHPGSSLILFWLQLPPQI